jgi:hypothetical protein
VDQSRSIPLSIMQIKRDSPENRNCGKNEWTYRDVHVAMGIHCRSQQAGRTTGKNRLARPSEWWTRRMTERC